MSKFEDLAFHKNGRPRGWVRSLLFSHGNKVRRLFRRTVYKKSGAVRPAFQAYMSGGGTELTFDRSKLPVPLGEWLEKRWQFCSPLAVFSEKMARRRVTILTDSVGPSSLFGGVGTSLILGALWASRSDADLRIVTRTEAPDSTALHRVLSANGLSFKGAVDFRRSELSGGLPLPVGDMDLFLSTSWWSTRSLIDTVGGARIVYLLQEDERLFYPNSDEHLACELTLAAPVARVVVNTGLLLDHLTTGSYAIDGLAARSLSFEPAFPYKPGRYRENGQRKRLFFYARPSNLRNLFATGMAAIGAAIEAGHIDARLWEIHMFGNNLPNLTFPGGITVVQQPTMDWARYQEEIAQMDAGFVLQYTPHPSYPPLDLASVGLPVLTNSFGVKAGLSAYSDNIIVVPPDPISLAQGLGRLTALALDKDRLATNFRKDRINRDWALALEHVVSDLDTLWKVAT